MTSYDLVLKGGMVYDPCTGLIEEEDVAVKDGKIAARGQGIASDADTIIEAEGCIVAPGLIDLHCHIYPMFTYPAKDSLRTTNAEEHMFQ